MAEDGREGNMIAGCTHPHVTPPPPADMLRLSLRTANGLKAIMHGDRHVAHVCARTAAHTDAQACTHPHVH